MRHLALPLAVIFLSAPVAGKSETVSLRQLDETLRETATVSGVVVVGAVLLPEGPDPAPRLAARLDPGWQAEALCVEVISADGLYQSQSVYDLAAGAAGETALPYPTRYPEALAAYAPGAISVRARLGDCGGSGALLPVAWRAPGAGPASGVALQVNSFRADVVQIFVGDDPKSPAVTCEPVETPVRTAFDRLCAFDLPQPVPDRLSVEILRISGGRAEMPEFVDLILAP